MDAPESAPADTLALPDAPPAITLGQALPFALAFEARRRQAADRRAARKLQRLKDTLRQCGELRARLAALCDAATAAAASGGDGEDARDGRIGRNAARELMLDAARGASRARGEPREGKPVFEPENRCAACEARAREASLSFAFVREARAFRLAELALSEDPDREDSRPVGSTDKTHTAAFQRPRLERKFHSGLSAEKRATAMLRGADDPPALFAAGTFLLTLVQTSAPDDGVSFSFSSREEPAFCLSRYDDHDANGRDVPTGIMPASDGDDKKVAEGYADVPTRDARVVPRVVDAEERKIPSVRNRKRDAPRAKKAEARVVAAARGFARSLEHAARTSVSPPDGSSSSPSSPSFFTRDDNAASDALRRDVVASLLAAAAPVASPGREENVPTDFHCWSASSASAVTSARLSRVALAEVADTDALAGDVLVVCATRIREGVLALRERRRRVTEETEQTAPSAGFFFRDAESRPEAVSDEKKNTRFREQNDRHDDRHDDRHYATRASRTLDEFGECQRLGFVFSVAERAAQRLRVSNAETNVLSAAETRDAERNAAFARAGLDAARAAAEAATAPDPAEPHESVALRLIGSRAIRLHAMVCVALGRRAPGTRA